MNDSDTDANVKAIDSLLNYETVKYFSAEEREAERYDRSMARYEEASIKAYTSLAVLNAGQAMIFTVGLAGAMVLCAYGIEQRHQHGRRFRHDQRHDDPALSAAQFHGHGLSRDQAGGDRHREDVHDSEREPEIEDKPGAKPLVVSAGAIRFDNVAFAYEPGAADPQGRELRGAGRQDGRDRRAVGRRQVDDLAAAVPLLRCQPAAAS